MDFSSGYGRLRLDDPIFSILPLISYNLRHQFNGWSLSQKFSYGRRFDYDEFFS